MLAWGLADYPVSVIFALIKAYSISQTFRNTDLPLILKSNGSMSRTEASCGADSRIPTVHADGLFRGTSGSTRRIELAISKHTGEIPGPGSKRLHVRRCFSV